MLKKLLGGSISDAVLAAMNKSLAIIEFDPAGNILTANENFLHAMGYEAKELAGQHHRMFVDADYARSAEYLFEAGGGIGFPASNASKYAAASFAANWV